MQLTPELLQELLQAGVEAGNRLQVDEPLLVLPDLPSPAPTPPDKPTPGT